MMKRKERFALEMDGCRVNTIEELREHFSYPEMVKYLKDGSLLQWLRDRYLEDILWQLNRISGHDNPVQDTTISRDLFRRLNDSEKTEWEARPAGSRMSALVSAVAIATGEKPKRVHTAYYEFYHAFGLQTPEEAEKEAEERRRRAEQEAEERRLREEQEAEERQWQAEREAALKEKRRRLAGLPGGEAYLDLAAQAAFDMDDLYDLLDEGCEEIYLCGERFSIPAGKANVTYIGVNTPLVTLSSGGREQLSDRGIRLENVRFEDGTVAQSGSRPDAVAAEAVRPAGDGPAVRQETARPEPEIEKPLPRGFVENPAAAAGEGPEEDSAGDVDAFLEDLEETIRQYLERMEGIETEGECSCGGIDCDPDLYDNETYVYDTRVEAKTACRDQLEAAIEAARDELREEQAGIAEQAQEAVEPLAESFDAFLEELRKSFALWAELYPGAGGRIEALAGEEWNDGMGPEDAVQELLAEKHAPSLGSARTYLESCEFEYDEDEEQYGYDLSSACGEIEEEVNETLKATAEDLPDELDERLRQEIRFTLEKLMDAARNA